MFGEACGIPGLIIIDMLLPTVAKRSFVEAGSACSARRGGTLAGHLGNMPLASAAGCKGTERASSLRREPGSLRVEVTASTQRVVHTVLADLHPAGNRTIRYRMWIYDGCWRMAHHRRAIRRVGCPHILIRCWQWHCIPEIRSWTCNGCGRSGR